MSRPSENLLVNRDRGPSWEEEIGEILDLQLRSPWSVVESSPLDVGSAGPAFSYAPDIMLKNDDTGEVLMVEIKTPNSLSIPNILKLKRIQTAVEDAGTDFLLLFEDDKSAASRTQVRLSEYGVKAVGVSNASDAADQIVKHLTLA